METLGVAATGRNTTGPPLSVHNTVFGLKRAQLRQLLFDVV